MEAVACSRCGVVVAPPYWPHIFESTEGLMLERLCDICCPRCWADRREVVS